MSAETDPFADVLGTHRGRALTDPSAWVGIGDFYTGCPWPEDDGGERDVAWMLEQLAPFNAALPVYRLDIGAYRQTPSLEGALRIVSLRAGTLGWTTPSGRVTMKLGESDTPALATVGALREALAKQDQTALPYFDVPESMHESLTAWQLFGAAGRPLALALVTVY